MPQNADFDLTDPYSPPPEYNVLHDPHLKEYFQNPAIRRRLLEKGKTFIEHAAFVWLTQGGTIGFTVEPILRRGST